VDKIRSILEKLETLEDVNPVRGEIVDLIVECLEAKKECFGDWERTHFSNAIGTFGLNIHSAPQPTVAWLRLCLIDLERAVAPVNQQDRNYRSPDPSLRDVTYQQLKGAVNSLEQELR
jgi:hypothetical protein